MALLNIERRASLDFDAIREHHPVSSVVGAIVKLHKAGHELKACCPLHADRTPSFTIFAGDRRYHCFGCGADGDVLDLVRQLHNVGIREAAEMLCGGDLPVVAAPLVLPRAAPDRDTVAEAEAIWKQSAAAESTEVEAYLRGRGITRPIPETLRFARLRYGSQGELLPVMVALVTAADNRPAGIQRTYLAPGGRGKADVEKAKLSLGSIRGGAIRLEPPDDRVIVCEGIEDGLSLRQGLVGPVWVSAGTSNLSEIELPPVVRSIVIGRDNDDAGRVAATKAANAFADRGLTVRIIAPADGHKDFNSELQGVQ